MLVGCQKKNDTEPRSHSGGHRCVRAHLACAETSCKQVESGERLMILLNPCKLHYKFLLTLYIDMHRPIHNTAKLPRRLFEEIGVAGNLYST